MFRNSHVHGLRTAILSHQVRSAGVGGRDGLGTASQADPTSMCCGMLAIPCSFSRTRVVSLSSSCIAFVASSRMQLCVHVKFVEPGLPNSARFCQQQFHS